MSQRQGKKMKHFRAVDNKVLNAATLFLNCILPLSIICTRVYSLIHDPRSELSRNNTSGEMAWLKSLRRDEANETKALKGKFSVEYSSDVSSLEQVLHGSGGKSGEENRNIKKGYYSEISGQEAKPLDFLEREIHFLSQPHGLNNETEIDRVTMAKLLNYVQEDHQEDSLSSLNTALFFLGIFYYYGLGDLNEADQVKAMKWFERAAENGHGDSQCVLGLLLYVGIKDKIGQDKNRAMRWFYLASQDGDHPRGHWLLGRLIFEGMYYDDIGLAAAEGSQFDNRGLGKQRNFKEASRLFQYAEKFDIPEAIHQLGVMYEYGLLDVDKHSSHIVEGKDHFSLAVEYYEKAASLDLVESIYHLGLMYAYGRGVELNYIVAADYFRRGAAKKHVPSMRYLAIFALNGYDQPNRVPNPMLAIQWFGMCVSYSGLYSPDIGHMCSSEMIEAKRILIDARAYMAQKD